MPLSSPKDKEGANFEMGASVGGGGRFAQAQAQRGAGADQSIGGRAEAKAKVSEMNSTQDSDKCIL